MISSKKRSKLLSTNDKFSSRTQPNNQLTFSFYKIICQDVQIDVLDNAIVIAF